MASYLETYPDDAECIAHCRRTGQFVPVARDGALLCLVNSHDIDKTPLAVPLPVEDYVVGLELLGFTFQLFRAWEGAAQTALIGEPAETLPEGWDRQSLRIMAAFGTGRRDEVVTFLQERG